MYQHRRHPTVYLGTNRSRYGVGSNVWYMDDHSCDSCHVQHIALECVTCCCTPTQWPHVDG